MVQELIQKLLQTSLKVLGLIPRSLSYKLASLLGHLWFLMDRRHRQVALHNLSIVFSHDKSEREINHLARTIFCNIAKIPFEMGWSIRLSEKELISHFDLKGLANFQSAIQKGRGAIMITAHSGNWEFLPATTQSIGYPVNILYRPLNFKPVDAILHKYRARFGAKMIPKKRSLRKILKSLQQGECVGILFDQDPGLANGIFVDFFGLPTCTNKGLAFIASKTKAPVVPVFIAREGMRFLVEFGEEIPLCESSDVEKNIALNTLAYNKRIENFIRKYPEQWFWVHRRWKHTSQCLN
ncbi:MAG: lauroyl acyltransferase [Desulfobacteraceae bacterium]|nr:MAG: lauroyl acyltransferase [Desulfobacteraceae bacterium]